MYNPVAEAELKERIQVLEGLLHDMEVKVESTSQLNSSLELVNSQGKKVAADLKVVDRDLWRWNYDINKFELWIKNIWRV